MPLSFYQIELLLFLSKTDAALYYVLKKSLYLTISLLCLKNFRKTDSEKKLRNTLIGSMIGTQNIIASPTSVYRPTCRKFQYSK